MTNQDLSRRAFIHTAGKAGMVAGLTGSVLTSFANTNDGEIPIFAADLFPIRNAPCPMPIQHWNHPLMHKPWKYTIPNTQLLRKNLAEAVAAEKVDTSSVSLEDLL